METTLSAQETQIHRVFSDDYLFTIPPVQRPYSWTTDESGELLNDLLNFIEHYEITEKNISKINEPYFLGSIVLVKKDGPNAEVLDGQQRLTTITILLATLRDFLSEEYANDIEKMIVQKGDRILNTSDTYRLFLRKKDNDFFRLYIQERGATRKLNKQTHAKTDSQRYIRDNAIYFKECLNEMDEQIIKVLPGVIATLCYIVVVSTRNFDSAFRIFTVLNDRGLDLMPSDIFKARVIGDIPDEEQEDYTIKWEDIELSLYRERFNKLFDHIRMIIQKRKGSENYKDEYDKIFSTISGKRFIDEILIPYSEIYLKLVEFRSFYADQPQMLKILSLLNKIDNSDWIPLAMYYIKERNERIEEFLYRLEKFAGISMILRKNFNWRMSKYSQILRELDNKEIDIFTNESTIEVTEEDEVAVLEKLGGDVYLDLKDTAKKYVLLRLDSLLTVGQPYYDYSVITVEHVLPQNPKIGSEWLRLFPDPDQYIHRLGNLVLLTRAKNSLARNYDFQKKKSFYFQSKDEVTSFALTTQVIQENEWTPAVLDKRQKKLIALLKKAWDLKEKEVTVQEPVVDILESLGYLDNNDNPMKKLYNQVVKDLYLSTFENEQTRNTIKYLFYKSYSAEDLLEKDLYSFNLIEISKVIKSMNPHNLSVAKTNGRFISLYISWAIEKGYSIHKSNPMKRLKESFYDNLLDKNKKVHYSFDEFIELLERLPNAQDQAFLCLLWEGVALDALNGIVYGDINWNSYEIKLREHDGYILKIDNRFLKYIENAFKETTFKTLKENGIYRENELLKSDFLFKNVKSARARENEPVGNNVFYTRLNNIKKEFDLEYMTPNSLKQSSMIKMAVDIFLEERILNNDQFTKIGNKYKSSKVSNGVNEYYNKALMRDYISPEKIKELYNLEIEF